MNKILLILLILTLSIVANASARLYEETSVKGEISGIIKKGSVIQMESGAVYEVHDRVQLRVRERSPEATVLEDGRQYILIIDGFDEHLISKQLVAPKSLPSVTDFEQSSNQVNSNITNKFEGWDGETIFVLKNGQIWQQTEYSYIYHYAYRPEVMISKVSNEWKLKVEGVDEMIEVKRLK